MKMTPKHYRRAAKANRARDTDRYLSGAEVGAGMRRQKAREMADLVERVARSKK